MILPFGRALNPYATAERGRWPAREMYCPHPATNWGLNPNYAPGGIALHTTEGFRKSVDRPSLMGWLESCGAMPRIYAFGQSSTYCTNLLGLGQAWPDKLAGALAMAQDGTEVAVVNGGVGGHSTYQSLTRFLAWGPVIKPALTVVYTCKNDLTAVRVSGGDEKRVAPDFQNIVSQFGWALVRKVTWRRPSIAVAFRDTDRWSDESDGGLVRFDDDLFQGVLSRYSVIADLAAQWGGKVLFVSEVIRPSSYRPWMDRINDALPRVAARHANAWSWDAREHLPQDDGHFEDKLHLTERGCDLLAQKLGEVILREKLLVGAIP